VVVTEKGEEKMVSLVVVVVEAQWEESQMKEKPSLESQQTHERSDHRRRKDETHQSNITGNPNATSNWIPTTISLKLRVITKEDTLDLLCQ
jgi:hypothetical protein